MADTAQTFRLIVDVTLYGEGTADDAAAALADFPATLELSGDREVEITAAAPAPLAGEGSGSVNWPSRFDADPEVLAWARARIQFHLDRYEDFARKTEANGAQPNFWRFTANCVRDDLIGGRGCSLASFDERMPATVRALAEGDTADG